MFNFFGKNKNKTAEKNFTNQPNFPPSQVTQNSENSLKKGALVFLLIIGIGSLIFGIFEMQRRIKLVEVEINTNAADISLLNNESSTNTQTAAVLEDLRDKDTDKDELSDYDELYQYRTSPYITDSDSDGLGDYLEISQGTDPNCPQGQDCGRAVNSNANAQGNTNAFFQDIQPEIDLNNLTADEIRDLLRNNGASESDLSQIDDASLMQTYQEVLAEQGGAVSTNTNTNSTAANTNSAALNINSLSNSDQQTIDTVTYEQLKNLTPAEIRQLLIETGVSEDTLNAVDDTTLQSIYRDALEQQMQSSTQ